MRNIRESVWPRLCRGCAAVFVGLGVVLLAPAFATAAVGEAQSAQSPGSLEPGEKHLRATRLINHFLQRYHYKDTKLNDALSASVLERYLESLDPGRVYFIRQDIDTFSEHESEFDDYLRRLELRPAYAIFDVFRNRVRERVRHAVALLDAEHDFDLDESYQFDRSEEPWAADAPALDEIWRLRVKNDILTLRLAGKEEDEIGKTLRARYEHTGRRTDQLNADDVFQIFMNAYVGSVEPHTSYFSPRASDNFRIRMSLSLEGIGAVLQSDSSGHTLVQRIVAGGPAERSGLLHADDRIIGVGQEGPEEIIDVIGWRLDDVVDLIRGPKGSQVTLQVLRASAGLEGVPEIVTFTRDRIKLEDQAAQRSVLELPESAGGRALKLGVIEIPSFYIDFEARARGDKDYRSTTTDVRRLLEELGELRVDGIIIDLRGDGGGALTEAIALTGLFIRDGPVVQVRYAGGDVEVHRDPDPDIRYDGPLAVLVDRDSASASEIFAAAIQDYGRGLVVGETTYGKGTVQNMFDLDKASRQQEERLGQLKLTIQQYFRVNGDSTQLRGVEPDVDLPGVSADDEYGERAFDNALEWTSITAAEFDAVERPVGSVDLDALRRQHADRVGADSTFTAMEREFARRRQEQAETTVSLRETDRREELRRGEERERMLRLSVNDEPDGDEEADPADELFREALLLESARVLADYIRISENAPPPAQVTAESAGPGNAAAEATGNAVRESTPAN